VKPAPLAEPKEFHQMSTLQQTESTVKPIEVTGVAFALGMEDGANGVSQYEGYMFFVGPILAEYMRGHQHGKAIRQHKQTIADEFAGALADLPLNMRYVAPTTDWSRVEDEFWG
jgi:hypothetical protein